MSEVPLYVVGPRRHAPAVSGPVKVAGTVLLLNGVSNAAQGCSVDKGSERDPSSGSVGSLRFLRPSECDGISVSTRTTPLLSGMLETT